MTKNLSSNRCGGFTLVELAIVLMIIGLLIGGILRGQELMENARITSTIQQVKAVEGALTTFRDTYSALPGDITNPSAHIPNCSVSPCADGGNGNGIIGIPITTKSSGISAADGLAVETRRFFMHMAAAHLISSVLPNGGDAFSGSTPIDGKDVVRNIFPPASVGGFLAVYGVTVPQNGLIPGVSGLFMVVKKNALVNSTTDGAGLSALSPLRAAQIDRKMDDGLPQTGDAIGLGTTECEGISGSNQYNQVSEKFDCGIAIRVQH